MDVMLNADGRSIGRDEWRLLGLLFLGDGRVLIVLDVAGVPQLTVVLHDANTIRLIGACPADDGEVLLQHLLANPTGRSRLAGL